MQLHHATTDSAQGMFRRLSGFDYLVLTGGAINLVVISVIVIYWLLS